MSILHRDVGSISLIIGPMFAGKTTELMRQVKRLVYARFTCCVIKYARDARYHADHVVAHDQQHLKATVSLAVLSDFGEEWRNYDAIAIDEGQFFPDLADWCNSCADAGKHVVVSALDGDYLRRPFGDIAKLIPFCENVTKVKAICMLCHQRDASFTRRTVASDQQELIGGSEAYIATCRECYGQPQATLTPNKAAFYQQAVRTIEALTAMSLNEDTNSLRRSNRSGKDDADRPLTVSRNLNHDDLHNDDEHHVTTHNAAVNSPGVVLRAQSDSPPSA